MVNDYLLNRKIRIKVGSSHSTWEDILFGVPQGSVLGPLLFTIFLCDLFVILQNNYFTSYADGTISYVVGNSPEAVLSELNDIVEKFFAWFDNNQMKANHGKCNLVLSTPEETNTEVFGTTIKALNARSY